MRFVIAAVGLIAVVIVGVVTFSYLKLSAFEDKAAVAHGGVAIFNDRSSSGIRNDNQSILDETGWAKDFIESTQSSYAYPALELDISFDLQAPEKTYKQFRVIVEPLDSYKFFCLPQVLSSNGMNYAYYKSGNSLQLMVSAKSEEFLNQVLSQLNRYEIKYQIDKS